LSTEARAGLQLFMDKGCSSCHSGVNIGGHGYYPFGLVEKPGADVLPVGDKGRFAVTETADDEYVFRAAPLRNIALTAPYFHSGKVWDLDVAVEIMAESQLGEALKPEETARLVAFLDSLTGTLPQITVPVLPPETGATPRPTQDIR
jgi:cytochrome c peroxidase